MKSLIALVTPLQIVRVAKVLAMLTAMVMTAAYVTDRLTVETAGIAAFVLAVCLLLAVPDQRGSELLGAAAVWMTTAEFMSASQSHHFALWRWAVSVATLALVIVPLKVQYLRGLARSNPYRPLGELDRRAWSPGVMPMGRGAASAARHAPVVITVEPGEA
ncbi:MAG: hypothetical protein RIS94_978 [Pseudomonadota bacterium]|jgi:hypothetical protein